MGRVVIQRWYRTFGNWKLSIPGLVGVQLLTMKENPPRRATWIPATIFLSFLISASRVVNRNENITHGFVINFIIEFELI